MIMFLINHQNNVSIMPFYTCRSAQLKMNRCMCKQECIKCLISNMCMRLPTIGCPHSVTKGQKTYATRKLNSSLRSGHSHEKDS